MKTLTLNISIDPQSISFLLISNICVVPTHYGPAQNDYIVIVDLPAGLEQAQPKKEKKTCMARLILITL